jgi:hypothetical protein
MLIVPVPRLRVDRLSNAAQYPQAAQIVVFHVLSTVTTEQADGSRGGVELRELVLFDGLPVARRSRVDGCRFEDDGGDAVGERAIDNVAEKGLGSRSTGK